MTVTEHGWLKRLVPDDTADQGVAGTEAAHGGGQVRYGRNGLQLSKLVGPKMPCENYKRDELCTKA
jgi:hypothetical protein